MVLGAADVLANSGLREIGWEYVILDDCWVDGRDANGSLFADEKK